MVRSDVAETQGHHLDRALTAQTLLAPGCWAYTKDRNAEPDSEHPWSYPDSKCTDKFKNLISHPAQAEPGEARDHQGYPQACLNTVEFSLLQTEPRDSLSNAGGGNTYWLVWPWGISMLHSSKKGMWHLLGGRGL